MWLCQCGLGNLAADARPPETCPLCGFGLAEYFENNEQEEEQEQ